MEINPEIKPILKACKVHIDYGILYLLAVYHNLDSSGAIPEEVVRKVNLSKIMEKDYTTGTITWNVSLFVGQEMGAFNWVNDWIKPFGEIGTPARKGTAREVVKRMKEWFAKNPEYRKEDVFAARDLYFRTEKPHGSLVKTSHKFIYEGDGLMRVSLLLLWCERLKSLGNTDSKINPNMKGTIM